MLLSFLAGYFETVFLIILLILIHELGHFLTGLILKLNVKEIRIFMFGGVTILDESLNLNIIKEILLIIMGPIFQISFFFLIHILYTNGLVNPLTYEKIYLINKLLLTFNLLPILPLDGGRLLNNILDLIFSYEISHKITIFISLIFIPVILLYDYKIVIILIILFLITKVIEEIRIHKYRLTKLLLERKLKNIKFKKCITIKNIKETMRNKNFYILKNGLKLYEKDYYKFYM